MQQYNAIKAKYPDAVLLFRVGDFYETFGEDAIKASRILGIVLTNRANGSSKIELAGFPHHSLDTYLPKLVRSRCRVAICDQLEDPKATKKIVKRGVTELVTPGVSYNDKTLDLRSNNFLASIHMEKDGAGVAFLDVSTGEFLVAEGNWEYVNKLLQSFSPSEVIYQKQHKAEFTQRFADSFFTYTLEDWVFTHAFTEELLLNHFGTKSLKGFGIDKLDLGIVAAGAALHYLNETQHNKVSHIASINRIEEDRFVWMDHFTIRNLEVLQSTGVNGVSLLNILDQTVSPMGARMLRRWLVLPLKEQKAIQDRLNIVDYFTHHGDVADELALQIKQMGDLERLISKVATARICPREVVQLKRALNAILPVVEFCSKSGNKSLETLASQLDPCDPIREKIAKELQDDAPVQLIKGNVIATGVSQELDELRNISTSAKDYLEQIRVRESEASGIPSLKIAFNNVFGYYLEVRNSHKDKVPEEWIRKQTLVNAERYITEELKELEVKILSANDKILALEQTLFNEVVVSLMDYVQVVQRNSQLIARVDVLLSFAKIALHNGYVKPELNESFTLNIKDGRHPVIEKQLPVGEAYVSNDVYLDNDTQQIIMITGPNMSGKSALLRQTALIVLMAQMGSFVPAKSASLGIVDKIFTRVGASDNISLGESTFMVEMNETASILNNVSDRSLILLDEIGRGTSTYDGISIAWAIAEFLHENKAKAKTLFATHYHELNEMTESFDRIKNFNVSVKEVDKKILFLRKLKPGGSAHSFGIHVAKMAGMPNSLIRRANDILAHLEKSHSSEELTSKAKSIHQESDMQLSFFQLDDPVLEQIKDEIVKTDINRLTPVEALLKLNEIKKMIGA
ncbi:MAG: DNA mismatch repair protein MutS [Flavobacteriales bacterium]|nr:DNA mismatch repair protein MutS [Flavobacteriales bacterium]